MASSRTNLKKIAEETQLSLSTVSRALSEKGRVSPATRRFVKETAERLGYTPDPMLSRLAAYRSRQARTPEGAVLAVLTDAPGELHPAGKIRMEGVRGRAHQLGYKVELFKLPDYQDDPKRLAETLRNRGIEALLVDAVRRPGSYETFPWHKFSVVAMGGGTEVLPISTVANDLSASIRLIWKKISEKGYRRPGLVLLSEGHTESFHMTLAAGKLAQSLYTELDEVPFHQLPATPSEKELADFQHWLDTARPDVVIGHSSVLNDLQKLRYQVPKTVAFACYALLASEIGEPHLAGVKIDLALAGALAVELCHLELERPTAHARGTTVLHLVEPDWQDGETLPEHASSRKPAQAST